MAGLIQRLLVDQIWRYRPLLHACCVYVHVNGSAGGQKAIQTLGGHYFMALLEPFRNRKTGGFCVLLKAAMTQSFNLNPQCFCLPKRDCTFEDFFAVYNGLFMNNVAPHFFP